MDERTRITLKGLAEATLNLIYPPDLYCVCCGNLIDGTRTYHLCDHCIRHIVWDRGEPSEKDGMKMMRCAVYGIYERTLIFSLKYNEKRYIARVIAEIMRDRLAGSGFSYDVIVPVPMSRKKMSKRGFNHTALIGKYLSTLTGVPMIEDAVLRTRDTRPMRGLSPTEREWNVKDSMELNQLRKEQLARKRILLIDDFYTTGSTAAETRRALMECEPAEVYFLAFAAK